MARNILVVEDDRNISELIQMYLVKEGFDVRAAADGGRAVEEFQKQVPDLSDLFSESMTNVAFSTIFHFRQFVFQDLFFPVYIFPKH